MVRRQQEEENTEADVWTHAQEENTINQGIPRLLPKRQTMQCVCAYTRTHTLHVNRDVLTSVCDLIVYRLWCVCADILVQVTQWRRLRVVGERPRS